MNTSHHGVLQFFLLYLQRLIGLFRYCVLLEIIVFYILLEFVSASLISTQEVFFLLGFIILIQKLLGLGSI